MKYFIFLLAVVSVNTLFAQKVTSNRHYGPKEIRTISFTPYFNEQGEPNQNFNNIFEEALSSTFSVCCQPEIEQKLLNNKSFNELAAKTVYIDLSELVRTKSNLFTSLTEAEKAELQKGFKNTDLIVITSKIDSRKVTKINGSGNISVSGNITVFDLRSGEFVAFVINNIKKKFDDMNQANPPLGELVNSLLTGLNEAVEN